MQVQNSILVDAPADSIFRLVAEVERWPEILPHYRWVRVLGQRGNQKLLKMAARRDWIPVSWTSIQEPRPVERRIFFQHVRGITRGMAVQWRIEPLPDGRTLVSIEHDLTLRWPLIGRWVADVVIGEFFVRNIARKTLRRVAELAECERSGSRGPASPA